MQIFLPKNFIISFMPLCEVRQNSIVLFFLVLQFFDQLTDHISQKREKICQSWNSPISSNKKISNDHFSFLKIYSQPKVSLWKILTLSSSLFPNLLILFVLYVLHIFPSKCIHLPRNISNHKTDQDESIYPLLPQGFGIFSL